MFPEVCEDLTGFCDGRYRAEIVQWDGDNVKERFDWIQTRTSSKNNYMEMAQERPCGVVLFDILGGNRLYNTRRQVLEAINKTGRRIKLAENAISDIEMDNMMSTITDYNLEGIVMKSLDGSKEYKWKPEFTEDVWWDGEYVEGKGKYSGMIGSLICHQYIGDNIIDIKTGGMTDALRADLIQMETPLCLEIKHSEYLSSGKLRYPRFKCLRPDKRPEDCVRRVEK